MNGAATGRRGSPRIVLAAVIASGTMLGASAPARAQESKKHAEWLAKEQTRAQAAADPEAVATARARWQRTLDRRIGKQPGKVISIYNNWTHEYLPVPASALAPKEPGSRARRPAGESGEALGDPFTGPVVQPERVNDFLRCHFTNQPADMDERLIHTLVSAAVHFDVTRVNIISGYRSDKYNLILRKKGHEVSRNSQHTKGKAVDFRLPGVSTERLHAWAQHLRMGGVGRYLQSGFIHVDTGRVRYWDGR